MFTLHELCENWNMQQLADLYIKHFICFALAFSINFMYMGNFLHKYGFKYVRHMYVESHLFWQHSMRVCYTHSLSASATVHLYWAVEKRQISANCRTCNEITTNIETCHVRMPHLTHSLPITPYNALMIEIFLLFSIWCHPNVTCFMYQSVLIFNIHFEDRYNLQLHKQRSKEAKKTCLPPHPPPCRELL